MTAVSGNLTSASYGQTYAPPSGGRFKVTVNGPFQGSAVLVKSIDGGTTFSAVPAPLQTLINNPTAVPASIELSDTTPNVLYAIQAVAPQSSAFSGTISFSFVDVIQAAVSGILTSPGMGSTYAPPGSGRFKVSVNGPFQGAAVLVLSTNGGQSFQPSPNQGSSLNGPLLQGQTANPTASPATAELTDTTANVLYGIQAVAPPGGTFSGSLTFSFVDVPQAMVTIANDRSIQVNGVTYIAGQMVTIDATDAARFSSLGFILPTFATF